MKEIKMSYSEYEQMDKLIHDQDKIIKEFKSAKNIVLIDGRREGGYNHGGFFAEIPKIICDEKNAKEYLKQEFEDLRKVTFDAQRYIQSMNREKRMKNTKKLFW